MKHFSESHETISSLPATVHHQLNMYVISATAAGVSLLAVAQPSEAKIVYTPAHVRIPFAAKVPLDLNHDGINDFRFHNFKSGTTRLLEIDAFRSNAVIVQSTEHGFKIADALPAGVSVGTGNQLFGGGEPYLAKHNRSGYYGQWVGVKNRYLGLLFKIKGKTHFGWARLSLTVKSHQFIGLLTGYAFETIPNKPIITGKTKGPDKIDDQQQNLEYLAAPRAKLATLGLLALGSPGLSVWRRDPLGPRP